MQSPCLRSFLASTFFHGTHAQTRPKLFACTDGFPSLPSQLIDHWLYLIHEYNISWFNFFKSNLKEYITICFSIFLLRVKEHFYILFSFRLDLELIQCLQSSLQQSSIWTFLSWCTHSFCSIYRFCWNCFPCYLNYCEGTDPCQENTLDSFF